MKKFISVLSFLCVISTSITSARAAEEFTLKIKDHHFIPETLEIPAGEKVKIIILNEDSTPEEFESYELNREKIIGGNSKGIVFVEQLISGLYKCDNVSSGNNLY